VPSAKTGIDVSNTLLGHGLPGSHNGSGLVRSFKPATAFTEAEPQTINKITVQTRQTRFLFILDISSSNATRRPVRRGIPVGSIRRARIGRRLSETASIFNDLEIRNPAANGPARSEAGNGI